MAILTSRSKTPGDLLVHLESLQYCTKTAKIRNKGVAEITIKDVVGYPLIAGTNGADYNIAVAGDEANVIALLVDGPSGEVSETIAATTNGVKQYQVVHRPPAILNQNALRTKDVAGANFNTANIVTALKALNFEFRLEPTKYTEM